MESLNTTNIVLIPKKKNPMTLLELRLIALCNIIMKIITNVVANRLKKVLKFVISESQSAFLPIRQISNNIMVAFEIMHYLKTKKFGKEGFMTLKLDMSKVYARIEWTFLKAIMLKMGFNNRWTHLIMKLIQGIRICRNAPVISHMLFADDGYLFCKADELQIQQADTSTKYLGLPNTLGRNKSVVLGYLKEKVKASIRSWNGKNISKPSKEIMIKTVAQPLPKFAMNVFLLPATLINEVEKEMSKFFWSYSNKSNSRISSMSWERMSRHKHVGDKDFMDARLGGSPSFLWRSIFEAKQVISSGSCWRIGTGKKINNMAQPWLNDTVNPFVTTESFSIVDKCVDSLFHTGTKIWDTEVIADIFNDRDHQLILNTMTESDLEEDILCWKFENAGQYSVRTVYKLLQRQKGLWADNTHHKFCKLQMKHVQIDNTCPVCGRDIESIIHALVQCEVTARSMENQTVNDSMNMTADPNAQITGSDGVHQQPINPNARIVRSDGGQTPVGHVPSGHVPVGHTVIGQFSVPLGQISAGFTPPIIPAVPTGVHTPVVQTHVPSVPPVVPAAPVMPTVPAAHAEKPE
ncbi:hypothetical protein AgCh_009970 [Apium graveolens]